MVRLDIVCFILLKCWCGVICYIVRLGVFIKIFCYGWFSFWDVVENMKVKVVYVFGILGEWEI